MHFSDRRPEDVPPPPTIDERARAFTVPVMTFVAQAAVEELGVGTTGSGRNDGPVILDSVSLSYTLWRNPGDHADPLNLAVLDPDLLASLDREPPRPLPAWMVERRERMRYPTLWEAVKTTLADVGAPAATLVAHANHVLHNAFIDERVRGEFPGELDSPVTERHIREHPLLVDGVEVDGLLIDTDPHVYAVGADLGDRILTSVIARKDLGFVTLAFETRPLG
jgi:hypothetical protein